MALNECKTHFRAFSGQNASVSGVSQKNIKGIVFPLWERDKESLCLDCWSLSQGDLTTGLEAKP
jgi:hypothetical protein